MLNTLFDLKNENFYYYICMITSNYNIKSNAYIERIKLINERIPLVKNLYVLLYKYYKDNDLEIYNGILSIKLNNRYLAISKNEDGLINIVTVELNNNNMKYVYSSTGNSVGKIYHNYKDTEFLYHDLDYVTLNDFLTSLSERSRRN